MSAVPVATTHPNSRGRADGRSGCAKPKVIPLSENPAPKVESYDGSQIQVLEGLSAVRKRPGMYIGSTGERGLHHMVWEVVDNSVDEAMAGHATGIDVALLADGGVRVSDDGRGIPVDIHPTEGIPTVEVVLTILHAGGKFGGGGYKVSGGLHGVGISVVNALSKRVEVQVKRGGSYHDIAFVNGGRTEAPMVSRPGADGTGTQVTYWADPIIFETTVYSWDTIAARFQQMAFLNKGLRITLTDEREPLEDGSLRTVTYHYENGLVDFVTHLNRNRTGVNASIIEVAAETEGQAVEIAMQWTDSFNPNVLSFANAINTHEGGTHEEGFRTALTGVINRYAREKGILKEKDENLSGDDIREGLTAVISVKIGEPQFEGQTKTKLGNSEVKPFVQRTLTEAMADWLDAHPAEAKDIITKAFQAAVARAASRKARDMVRRKTVLGGASMPGKLKDCTTKDATRGEVYIVEGDSAGGSAAGGRDPETQAILPIRGKILNVEKARLDKVLANTEVQAIITALGCGIGEEFDITKLRYHKVVLMSDADVDGAHIQTLLLTLLFRHMRPLVEAGHVFMAMPPLFKVKWDRRGTDSVYAYSDAERDAILAEGIANGKGDPSRHDGIQRFKGLGEMNADELWTTTMDPAGRILKRVTLDDAALADELFSILMGDDVEPRRDYINSNAADKRFAEL